MSESLTLRLISSFCASLNIAAAVFLGPFIPPSDGDQSVRLAIDGHAPLFGCELAADLRSDSGEPRKGADRAAVAGPIAGAQVAVRAHAGTERQAGNRRAGEIDRSHAKGVLLLRFRNNAQGLC